MKLSIVMALLALALVGCTNKNPPIQPRQDPWGRSQIHMTSEDLRRETYVDQPIVTRDDAGNLVHVTVPIRSAINKTLYVDYYVTFFDRNGQPISRLGPFTKTLQANTPDSVTFNSVSARATDFQVDFRYAR